MEAPRPSSKLCRFNQMLQEFRDHFQAGLEGIFYRLGLSISFYPGTTIILAVCLCAMMGCGMVFFRQETDNLALWTSYGSRIRQDAAWVNENFQDYKYETIIITADNVLDPEVMTLISRLSQDIMDIDIQGKTTSNICAKPGHFLVQRRPTGGNKMANDNSLHQADQQALKNLLEGKIKGDCVQSSLLNLWQDISNPTQFFETLSLDDILTRVKNAKQSSSKTALNDPDMLLSGMYYDTDGNLLGATSTIINLIMRDIPNVILLDDKPVPLLSAWELEFINVTINSSQPRPNSTQIYSFATRSYDDGINEVVEQNMMVLAGGFTLIFLYVAIMLGRWNLLHHKMYLSFLGMMVVGMSILASFGFCSYLGFFYGPIHPILPFLLLGIGVDDMFIIIQGLLNLSPQERASSVPEIIGLALKYSGVSITITSFTDIVAFGISATTAMPALKSFCVFALAGIAFVFLFQITFFVACVSLDEYRIHSNRDGCCCIPLDKAWKGNSCSQKDFLRTFFENYFSPFIATPVVKVIIIITTLGVFGTMIYGITQWQQDFDRNWYLMDGSYQRKFAETLMERFPEYGELSQIYFDEINYIEERHKLIELYKKIQESPFVKKESVDFWLITFQQWLNDTLEDTFPETEEQLKEQLLAFIMFHPEGQNYLQDIRFEGSLISEFKITASKLRFNHIQLANASEELRALDSLRDISDAIKFDSGNGSSPIVYTFVYTQWEANRVISGELIRNMALTLAAVMLTATVLIGNLLTSFWVFTCVCFTVADVAGCIALWGLPLEIVSSIELILSIGLAVDYAAHMGHYFMTVNGSKPERSRKTLGRMGPAVWNGGFSTFLAFVLLANSESYVFKSFFKVFFSVVLFGLFHGLCYLPVILSWLGPAAHNIENIEKTETTLFTNSSFYNLKWSEDAVFNHIQSGYPEFKEGKLLMFPCFSINSNKNSQVGTNLTDLRNLYAARPNNTQISIPENLVENATVVNPLLSE